MAMSRVWMKYSLWITWSMWTPEMMLTRTLWSSNPTCLANGSLCKIIAVLPATSVDCERGFSSLNHIKNDYRSRLKTEHLEPLIRISTIEMDALTLKLDHSKELILAWRRAKNRRTGGRGDQVHETGTMDIDEGFYWRSALVHVKVQCMENLNSIMLDPLAGELFDLLWVFCIENYLLVTW